MLDDSAGAPRIWLNQPVKQARVREHSMPCGIVVIIIFMSLIRPTARQRLPFLPLLSIECLCWPVNHNIGV